MSSAEVPLITTTFHFGLELYQSPLYVANPGNTQATEPLPPVSFWWPEPGNASYTLIYSITDNSTVYMYMYLHL